MNVKRICKTILYSIAALNTIATALSSGDASPNSNGKTCSSGCDASDSTKVILCDRGSILQKLFNLAKPKAYCANPNANRKLGRWLRSGRASCGQCSTYFSCQAALNAGLTSSGLYQLSVDGGTTTFTAYCDQKTAGGGWMLFVSYMHYFDENLPLDDSLPTDPENGYSDVVLQQVGYNYTDIESLRFYCTASSHPRILHFINNNTNILQKACDGTSHGNNPSYWNTTDFSTLLSDHNASLPLSVNHADPSSGSFLNNAFYYLDGVNEATANYYTVAPDSGFYHCDNNMEYVDGGIQDTHHTIWVRMKR